MKDTTPNYLLIVILGALLMTLFKVAIVPSMLMAGVIYLVTMDSDT